MATRESAKWLVIGVTALTAAAVWIAWWQRDRTEIPAAVAAGKGRIEASEYDIVTRRLGRIERVLVAEGDLVENGQAVARLDTTDLQAELTRADAELKQAREAKKQALASVAQRESDIEQALVAIPQRESELSAATAQAERSEELFQKQYIAKREFEQDQTRKQAAEASLAYERARKQTAEAALKAAQIKVIHSDAAIDGAEGRIQKITAEIADSVLTAPVRGRIWHQHVEPGAFLTAGDKVLTLLRLDDTTMMISLATSQAERVTVGSEARIVFDAAPEYVIPATVSSVTLRSDNKFEKQTAGERSVSLIKIQIDPELLENYLKKLKGKLNGIAYVRLAPDAPWPDYLAVKMPQRSTYPSRSAAKAIL